MIKGWAIKGKHRLKYYLLVYLWGKQRAYGIIELI